MQMRRAAQAGNTRMGDAWRGPRKRQRDPPNLPHAVAQAARCIQINVPAREAVISMTASSDLGKMNQTDIYRKAIQRTFAALIACQPRRSMWCGMVKRSRCGVKENLRTTNRGRRLQSRAPGLSFSTLDLPDRIQWLRQGRGFVLTPARRVG